MGMRLKIQPPLLEERKGHGKRSVFDGRNRRTVQVMIAEPLALRDRKWTELWPTRFPKTYNRPSILVFVVRIGRYGIIMIYPHYAKHSETLK